MSLAAQAKFGVSARCCHRLLGLSRSAAYYRSRKRDDGPVIDAVNAYMEKNPGTGFDLMYDEMTNQIIRPCGKTRLYRVYCQLGLNMKRRGKKRLPERVREPLAVPLQPNETWSADFMSDATWSGRKFRTFNVLDDFNRESLRIEVDTSLPSARVIRAFDELIELRGKPARIRLDNGPEFVSKALADWAKQHDVHLHFIQRGKPTQNAYVERFNRTYRTEVLDRYIFTNLAEVRRQTELWRQRYNTERPHKSLGGLPPHQYAMANCQPLSTS